MLRAARLRIGLGLLCPLATIMVRESLDIVANRGCFTRSHIVASHSCMPLRSCTGNHRQVQAPSYCRPQTLLKICPCDWPSVSCAPPEGKPKAVEAWNMQCGAGFRAQPAACSVGASHGFAHAPRHDIRSETTSAGQGSKLFLSVLLEQVEL